MGIERLLNLVDKRIVSVPPRLSGYHGTKDMRQYLRVYLKVYEQVKREELAKKRGYDNIPLSWDAG